MRYYKFMMVPMLFFLVGLQPKEKVNIFPLGNKELQHKTS